MASPAFFLKNAVSICVHMLMKFVYQVMVSSAEDRSIVSTCLREMEEEITGLTAENTTVLGVLRCNWGEVHQLVGVAVTPVVCYVGEIGDKDLQPNPNEVAECFTVPLACLLDSDR